MPRSNGQSPALHYWIDPSSRLYRLSTCEQERTINSAPPRLRIQLGVPIEIVEPALVQIVRREQAAVAMQLVYGRGVGRLFREHLGLLRRQVALPQVAGRAG